MAETILTKLAIAAIILILLILLIGRRILQYKVFITIFFIVYFADNLLIVLTNVYPSLQIIPSHIWEGFLICNWSGKLYSIIFTLTVLYFSRRMLSFKEIGLTLQQEKGSVLPCTAVILALSAWATMVGTSSPKGDFDAFTLIYLAIMPALNEELVYRGCLLGILDKLMPSRINFLGAQIGWGVIVTSILFSLLHGFSLDHTLSLHIEAIALTNSFISGLIFAWLRERSGSLVMPMIAHGLEDFLFFLPRML